MNVLPDRLFRLQISIMFHSGHYDEDGCELDAHGNAKAPDAADDAFEKLLVYAVPNNKIDL